MALPTHGGRRKCQMTIPVRTAIRDRNGVPSADLPAVQGGGGRKDTNFTLGDMESLIVDGANVVGSRPNGWWRDRAGAARRLWQQLTAAELPQHEVVLVLEGAARQGVPAGREGRVDTIHAPASGDDAIVEAVRARVADGPEVTVVTADRELRARVEAVGARTVGPSWLLERL